jgi:2-amino-4-hydroxy-6-hydroxymethyldihydropteridine diphosphokinase
MGTDGGSLDLCTSESPPPPVWLGLGGNLGPVADTFAAVRSTLEARSERALRVSPLVRSPAWPPGAAAQPDYLNQVVGLWPWAEPDALMAEMLALERSLGRGARAPGGSAPRAIDIDILAWGPRTVRPPGLTIPHPRLAGRRFVLMPWAAVAPAFVVPGLERRVDDLLAACSDPSPVSWYSPVS